MLFCSVETGAIGSQHEGTGTLKVARDGYHKRSQYGVVNLGYGPRQCGSSCNRQVTLHVHAARQRRMCTPLLGHERP
jgi:hypothetical protein